MLLKFLSIFQIQFNVFFFNWESNIMYKRTSFTQVYQNHSQHYNNYIFLLLHRGLKNPIFLSKVPSLLVIFGTSSTAVKKKKNNKQRARHHLLWSTKQCMHKNSFWCKGVFFFQIGILFWLRHYDMWPKNYISLCSIFGNELGNVSPV